MKNLQVAFGTVAVCLLIVVGCGGRYHRDGSTAGTSTTDGGTTSDATVRSDCAANLKKLHYSLVTYASDYDDVLPPAAWNTALTPYLPLTSATLRCPAVSTGVGYAYSASLVGTSLNAVATPDATPLFFDTADLSANVVGTYSSTSPTRHGGPAVVYVSGRTVPETADGGGGETQVRDVCRSHLGQVATSMALYASDNDDHLPPSTWVDAVTPYANGNTDIFRCPAVAVGSYGYAFNQDLLSVNTTTIESPATVPSAFDSSILTRNAVSPYSLYNLRHGSGVTAYADGHVSP